MTKDIDYQIKQETEDKMLNNVVEMKTLQLTTALEVQEPITNNAENIYTAFLKAQKEIPDIPKNKHVKTPYMNYSYSDTPMVIKTIVPVLNKYGIIFYSYQREDKPNFLRVNIMHAASQTVMFTDVELIGKIPTTKDEKGKTIRLSEEPVIASMQDLGSSITYAERYGLLCLTGQSPGEYDDDAAKVSEKAQNNLYKKYDTNQNNDMNQKSDQVVSHVPKAIVVENEAEHTPIVKAELLQLWMIKKATAMKVNKPAAEKIMRMIHPDTKAMDSDMCNAKNWLSTL